MKRFFLNIILILVLVLSFTTATFAQDVGPGDPDSAPPEAAYQGDPEKNVVLDPTDLEVVSIIVTFEKGTNEGLLETVSGGQIVNRFSKVFNGVSMVLDGEKVEDISGLPGVTGVYLDQLQQLDTDVSTDFIGAPVLWDQLGGQDLAGEGTIVGVLDSGIWPEHPSFADDGSFPVPPVIPGSNGFGGGIPRSTCDFGNTAFNPNDAAFTCNNKLIGAYDFTDTYKFFVGLLPTEFASARDADGHGTHTASTAAGNGGVAASIFGVQRGTVSGVAPRAQVIMYKVCGDAGCYNSDSIMAVEQAILDDVDSINFSISGGGSPYSDVVELAFAIAYENGVFVTASAGNSGPGPDTVAHRGPWTMTVGASTSNRHFISTVSLTADNGDTLTLEGATITDGISTLTTVVFPPNDPLCLNPYPAGTFSGEIVICQRGAIARVAKSFNVSAGGAGGLLLYNPVQQGLATDNHFIPSVHLEDDAGVSLLNFMSTHTGVEATFTQGVATTVQGDKMASFSSRGGINQTLGISKPDITAPGVQILAGHTPLPATINGGMPGQHFQSIQGTSMSSPHVAGSAALVKAAHPDWTPGQIKSALMMTAKGTHVKENGVSPADAFDYGSGRVDLSKAAGAGFTISESKVNFFALENELWNANYPSLYIPALAGKLTVQRTVHSERSKNALWKLSVDAPADLIVSVPNTLNVKAGQDATFEISVDASVVPFGEVRFATLYFNNKGDELRFPITIVRREPIVYHTKSCTPASISLGGTTECTIEITNTSFDDAAVNLFDRTPAGLPIVPGSAVGADQTGAVSISYSGVLAGASPPIVNVAVDPLASPYGYIPLSIFFAPLSGVGDETIINFDVSPFQYAGETYNRIGMVSNGYLVVGGGTGADVDYINTDLPDPAAPNNVLAPFWTDLNPSAGGDLYAGSLTDGVNTWAVFEWENVPNWGDGLLNTFQVWVTTGSVEDISFVYGPVISAGDGGYLTVGAENVYGNSGGTVYFDGVGSPPVSTGYEVDVFSTPGAPGETHTITYTNLGENTGTFENCAELTSDLFQGTSVTCFNIEVTP